MNLETTLERTTPARAHWDTWIQREPALAALSYQDLRRELRTGSQAHKDELLGALVRLVQADSGAFGTLAACLLPGLRHRVARYAPSLDRQEALAVMLAGLYEGTTRYDLEVHARFIAEKLLALPTRRLRRAVATQRTWSAAVRHGTEVARQTSGPELSPRALLAIAVDAGVLTEHDTRLILDTRLAGRPLREAARRLGLTYEAAKKRRQRAEARWAAWWAPAATPAPTSANGRPGT